jgi:hypothetical protein
MTTSASTLDRVKGMAAAGRHADVVAALSTLEHDEVEAGPPTVSAGSNRP